MAWDDPVVWILIIAVVVFLFGANKIPQFARSIGQARREFNEAWKGSPTQGQQVTSNSPPPPPPPVYPTTLQSSAAAEDPIVVAARNEGIVTEGKTRQQIASELAWKLKQKESM
jgi:sec-independent protein translocase protein TatA